MGKNIGKNIRKNLSGKYSQKPLDHVKISATDANKTTSKTVIQKTAEATCNLIGNKIVKRITKVQKFRTIHNRIIQKQLQMKIIRKYLKKDIYISQRKTENYW